LDNVLSGYAAIGVWDDWLPGDSGSQSAEEFFADDWELRVELSSVERTINEALTRQHHFDRIDNARPEISRNQRALQSVRQGCRETSLPPGE
jgi:hypothetical protein